jgi:mitochondrial fission protein ELM1
MCYRQGDNSQILALAEALGWPFEVKRLAYRSFGYAIDVWRGTTLLGIDRGRSSPLDPPWPDLVISASMRNEPVCRWIRTQSGGRTRYVHMGRTWGRLESFDLVVTSPEFRLRKLPNVHHNALTLTRVTSAKLAEAAATWTPRLAHLPRPRIAVFVGGYGGPYAFDPGRARRLGQDASAMAREARGSLLVTTSARTKRASVQALEAAISVPCHFFRWAAKSADNPFYGYLALADSFIVTCDSASMLAEACATRRPVYIFDLGPRRSGAPPKQPEWETLGQRISRWWRHFDFDRVKAFIYRQMLKVPPRRMTRDIRLIHHFLIDQRRAVWLGQPFPAWTPPPLDEMTPTVARIRGLLGRAAQTAGDLGTTGCQTAAKLPTSL